MAPAHGKFLAASYGARQQQIREVHTNYEQNGSHRRPQHDQRASQLSADMLLEEPGNQLIAPFRFRILRVEIKLRGDDLRVGMSLCEVHTGLKPANQSQDVAPHAHVIEDGWRVEIDLRAWGKHRAEIEGIRQHPDHSGRRAVQVNGGADDCRVSLKSPSPERIGQQCSRDCRQQHHAQAQQHRPLP